MRLWNRARALFNSLFRKARAERDLDDEVRAYVEMLAEDKTRSGTSPGDALRSSRMETGGVEQLKEEIREQRPGYLFGNILQDLKYGRRML